MQSAALVVQCFNKPDTLKELCQSLLRCAGIDNVSVIFWCDNPTGNKNEARYAPLHRAVLELLSKFIAENSEKFASVELKLNESNLGCYKTCQIALDYAFENQDFAIFVEDDVIFSSDAFLWFDGIRKQGLLDNERYWAITGESVFFNSGDQPLPEGWREKMVEMARREGLAGFYITHNFLPSTCFATTGAKWAEFGATRGLPVGDVHICERCAKEDRHGIFPVVPRVKDVGMLHENGYSVSIHTAAGVTEIKNTYILAEDLIADGLRLEIRFSKLTVGIGELYSQSSKLIEPN